MIVTGLSGAGKGHALRALEDLGYYCVDNLPVVLIPTLARRTAAGHLPRTAVVVDVREGGFLDAFPDVLATLRATSRLRTRVIFLEALTSTLVRRFSETRRPHPLARGRSALEGLREERQRLATIRALADDIVDTSDLTVHELRHFFMGLTPDAPPRPLVVTVLSFGFKYGLPVEADLVFDARCLPNPHFVPSLRQRTGRDQAVVAFMDKDPATAQFIDHLERYLQFVLPYYVREGKSYLTIAVGCTGGRHRSVMIAERLTHRMVVPGNVRVRVKHRDMRMAQK